MVFGLNISNQGMNSLTMQDRKPVVGLQNQGNTVSVFTLGESHNYGKQEAVSKIIDTRNKVWIFGKATIDQILRGAQILENDIIKLKN
jgi:hypothetical protein